MRHKFCRLCGIVLAVILLLATYAGASALAEESVKITLNVERVVVDVGKVAALKISITPKAAGKAGFTCLSTDEAVAKVDSRGRVQGVAEGACEIRVASKADESVSLVVPVSVVVPVKRITVTADATTINVGQTAKLTCSYQPENATMKSATFSSAKESVATVDENGVVTGVARGRTDIIVRSADGDAKTSVRVTVRQQPTGVTVSPTELALTVGKRGTLKASVQPKNADSKAVIWSSSNENVAKVDKRGQVTAVSRGDAVITVACAADSSVSASVPVKVNQLAKTASFGSKEYAVIIGQTLQLDVTVGPDDTSDQTVTYHAKNPKIASVDANGVVTGLKGGKTTVTATTADGSRRRATTTVEVIVPVTGVHFESKGMRVGAGSYAYATPILEPKDATDRYMTWESSDESIATVRGDRDKVKVSGRRWGRCQVTGTTEDGGYRCTIDVNVGSLRHAVVVDSIEIKNGAPYIVLHNKSDMNIISVSYAITGTDEQNNFVRMSTRGDVLYGVYEDGLPSGAKTHHGRFTFYNPSRYPNLQHISIAVTSWTTDDGYYANDGTLKYSYTIPEKQLEWVSWDTELYKQIQGNPRAH